MALTEEEAKNACAAIPAETEVRQLGMDEVFNFIFIYYWDEKKNSLSGHFRPSNVHWCNQYYKALRLNMVYVMCLCHIFVNDDAFQVIIALW